MIGIETERKATGHRPPAPATGHRPVSRSTGWTTGLRVWQGGVWAVASRPSRRVRAPAPVKSSDRVVGMVDGRGLVGRGGYGTVKIGISRTLRRGAQRWRIFVRFKRRPSSRRLRAVLAGTDTRALLGHRYLDEQRAERALGAGAGGGGDRAGWPRRATSSFEVSEMEMVKQNDLPER